MKKIFVFAAATLLVTGITFAENGKDKKKTAKGKTCCAKNASGEKSCSKDKTKTAKI